jgi:hypothetical protein
MLLNTPRNTARRPPDAAQVKSGKIGFVGVPGEIR